MYLCTVVIKPFLESVLGGYWGSALRLPRILWLTHQAGVTRTRAYFLEELSQNKVKHGFSPFLINKMATLISPAASLAWTS